MSLWLALIALAGAGAPAAHAAPAEDFTPELAISSSGPRAGDHPALRVEMQKPFNHCTYPEPPYTRDHGCEELYMQQNLKMLAVQLPPGLEFDAAAAPYCDPHMAPGGWLQPDDVWLCRNEDARVGRVSVTAQVCDWALGWEGIAPTGCLENPLDFALPDGAFVRAPGVVYNDAPGPDEVGHLVVLWPKPEGGQGLGAAIRTDFRVTIDSDGGTNLVADDIPDVGPLPDDQSLPGQVTELTLVLDGSVGGASGHPLLTNPFSCGEGALGIVARGYLDNSEIVGLLVADPGEGGGESEDISVPYRASECEPLPFNPRLDLGLDDWSASRTPAIFVTLAQAAGEATAEQLELTFPPSFELNRASRAKQCSLADVAARSCPSGSKVGEVDVELSEGQTLSGHAYLTGLAEREAKLALLLDGAFDLRFDATVRASEDGSAVLAFEGLPAVTRLKLNLAGGANGILGAPNACGPQTVLTRAESRLGQVKRDSNVVAAGECPAGPPAARGEAPVTFAARLSEPRPGRLTDLDLRVVSREAPIVGVQYRLDGRLGWHVRKRRVLDRRRKATAGWTSVEDLAGARKARLRVLPGGRASVLFSPTAPVRRKGSDDRAGSEFGTLWASLSRANAARQSTLALAGLPRQGVTATRLSLRGRSPRSPLLLRNPRRCGRPLGFEAVVWVAGGQKRTLSQAIPLKGRGCSRR